MEDWGATVVSFFSFISLPPPMFVFFFFCSFGLMRALKRLELTFRSATYEGMDETATTGNGERYF